MLVIFIVFMMMLMLSRGLRVPRLRSCAGRGSLALFGSKTRKSGYEPSSDEFDYEALDLEAGRRDSVPISWYPGHIAKAERQLADYLKKVDVVIEVRDCRIPLSTTHPSVPSWVGSKPLIVAIARTDQVSTAALRQWKEYYAMHPVHKERPDSKVYFIDGKVGAGIMPLKKQALKAADAVNARRLRRGIQPRAVRAAVIGYPNVGKSALINKLLGKKMAKSRNMPGVTKSMQWVRIGKSLTTQEGAIELLDSPGIIPARQVDQGGAVKLAICNDIGEASYDRVVIAGEMCESLIELFARESSFVDMRRVEDRYGIPFRSMSGEEIVHEVAERFYKGNSISAADKLLGDFRRGFLGSSSLEAPIDSPLWTKPSEAARIDAEALAKAERKAEAKAAREASETSNSNSNSNESGSTDGDKDKKKAEGMRFGASLDIGKGNYDGW
jgi:ribosome biogenesis GTPase A